jgi:hypothetical protein
MLRRDLLTEVVEVLTPEEREQLMGNRGDVYKRHYMPAGIVKLPTLGHCTKKIVFTKQSGSHCANLLSVGGRNAASWSNAVQEHTDGDDLPESSHTDGINHE